MRLCSAMGGLLVLVASVSSAGPTGSEKTQAGPNLWAMAQEKGLVHRFSTLFTAQDVRDSLATDAGLNEAVAWCKATGVTKVYIEVFRGNYQADRDTLVRARDRFAREGFIVGGCVTTTRVGKDSTRYKTVSCYTDPATHDRLEKIFRYAAGLFDVIMIDDFWFTDCECDECKKARGDKSWAEYRCALMTRMSLERVIGPAREVNPKVRIIIKYPEWYDTFHDRGYDVTREPELFDVTWIGTETRDPDNPRWGKKPQYGAYWISLWARAFSRGKLGGGWYDPLGTTPNTYVEQGRQTILGLCPESMLFCYGALHRDTGPDDVAALRRELPGQIALAELVRGEKIRGVGTYKPPSSPPREDAYIFNFAGMLGIPMTADVTFPAEAPSLFLTCHALADPKFESELGEAVDQGRPILLTSSLRASLPAPMRERLSKPNIQVLELKGKETKASLYGVLDSVRDLVNLPREKVDALRRPLLEPMGVDLSAPPRVALYLYGERKVVLENFNDEAVQVALDVRGAKEFKQALVLPPGAEPKLETTGSKAKIVLPARSLLALTVR